MPTTQKVNRPLPTTTSEVSKPQVSKPQKPEAKPQPKPRAKDKIAGLPITSIDEAQNYLKFLIFGDAGVGKTVLAASAEEVPEMSPVLFIDAEGGTLSLQGLYEPDVVRVSTFSDVMRILKDLQTGDYKYQTVVLDSLSEIADMAMIGLMEDKAGKNPNTDIHLPDFGDWRKYTHLVETMIREFRNLNMNVIFTSGVQRDDLNGIKVAYPLMDGKVRVSVRYYLDLVLYMYPKMVGTNNLRLITGTATNTVAAKNRGYNMPPVIENPTMKVLYEKIRQAPSAEDGKEDNGN